MFGEELIESLEGYLSTDQRLQSDVELSGQLQRLRLSSEDDEGANRDRQQRLFDDTHRVFVSVMRLIQKREASLLNSIRTQPLSADRSKACATELLQLIQLMVDGGLCRETTSTPSSSFSAATPSPTSRTTKVRRFLRPASASTSPVSSVSLSSLISPPSRQPNRALLHTAKRRNSRDGGSIGIANNENDEVETDPDSDDNNDNEDDEDDEDNNNNNAETGKPDDSEAGKRSRDALKASWGNQATRQKWYQSLAEEDPDLNETPIFDGFVLLHQYFEEKWINRRELRVRLLSRKREDGKETSRLVVRMPGTHNLVANVLVSPLMRISMENQGIRIASPNAKVAGGVELFYIKPWASSSQVQELYNALNAEIAKAAHLPPPAPLITAVSSTAVVSSSRDVVTTDANDNSQAPFYAALRDIRTRTDGLTTLNLDELGLIDANLFSLLDALTDTPNNVRVLLLDSNRLTDTAGTALGLFMTENKTIYRLSLTDNQFTETTYLALASAMHTNSVLRLLALFNNVVEDQAECDTHFHRALQVNPNRPADSQWWLYDLEAEDFTRIKEGRLHQPKADRAEQDAETSSPADGDLPSNGWGTLEEWTTGVELSIPAELASPPQDTQQGSWFEKNCPPIVLGVSQPSLSITGFQLGGDSNSTLVALENMDDGGEWEIDSSDYASLDSGLSQLHKSPRGKPSRQRASQPIKTRRSRSFR